MNYSDYIIYADESGDPGLASVDPNYPVFALNFCLFRKARYAAALPAMAAFKFAHFGHDIVVLHENAIRLQSGAFSFLRDERRQAVFMNDLDRLIRETDFTVIAAVVDKQQLTGERASLPEPYELALAACVERLYTFLEGHNQTERATHIIIESRGTKEDRELERAFQRIVSAGKGPDEAMTGLELIFSDKKTNSVGLQVADLTASPIGRHFIHPSQPNRAWNAINPKLLRSPNGSVSGWGITVLPKQT